MEAETVEFQDWEVLPKSDDTALVVDSSSSSVSVVLGSASTNFDEVESQGTIRYDYFSLDNKSRYVETVAHGDVSEEGSVDSDNPSWIDPSSLEHDYGRKNAAEFWSDSGSDRSDERKFGDFDTSNELGLTKIVRSLEDLGETESGILVSGEFRPDSESRVSDLNSIHELGFVQKSKSGVGFEKLSEIGRWDKNSDKNMSDSEISYGDGAKPRVVSKCLDAGSQAQEGEGKSAAEDQNFAVAEVKHDAKPPDEGEKMKIVWWKVPLEVVKYCVYRVSPLWSFSVAAAFVGVIFLGRKLYKMKRKSPGLQLKVTMDDKKVSQFMIHAARLNEAFSVVRRVPIIRPLLPVSGVTPWPLMSLR